MAGTSGAPGIPGGIILPHVVLDTSAWLEYFNAGPHGPTIRRLLEAGRDVFTPAVVAAEIVEAARLRKANSRMFLQFLRARSLLVPVDAEIARLAGRINAERGRSSSDWTMLESLVLATARHLRARLLTLDPIYAGHEDVRVLSGPTHGGGPRASA